MCENMYKSRGINTSWIIHAPVWKSDYKYMKPDTARITPYYFVDFYTEISQQQSRQYKVQTSLFYQVIVSSTLRLTLWRHLKRVMLCDAELFRQRLSPCRDTNTKGVKILFSIGSSNIFISTIAAEGKVMSFFKGYYASQPFQNINLK